MVSNLQDRSERSNPKGNQTPHTTTDERVSERGEGVIGGVGNEIRLGTSWRKTKMVSQ